VAAWQIFFTHPSLPIPQKTDIEERWAADTNGLHAAKSDNGCHRWHDCLR
jgi:hypothetical protein